MKVRDFCPHLSAHNLPCLERQSEVYQVVEEVGLVASGFQFFTRLGSVFAEEVGGFGMVGFLSGVKRSLSFV